MAAFKPLPLFFSLSFLTTGLMLFPPAGAASVLFSCLATGVTALGIVAWIQGARCAIELASWKGALRTLARVLAGGLFVALSLLLAWSLVGGDWIERIRGIPGSWIEMAPTSLLARAYHLAGEGRLADLPGPLALLGAFAAAGFLFGWRLTRRRVFLAGGSRPAPAGPRDRIPGLAAVARAGPAAALSEPGGPRAAVPRFAGSRSGYRRRSRRCWHASPPSFLPSPSISARDAPVFPTPGRCTAWRSSFSPSFRAGP